VNFNALGDAKKKADANAKRDDCIWRVWHNRYYTRTVYTIADEFSAKDYWWDKVAYEAKPPKKKEAVSEEAVMLTPEERKLVAAVLDPKEIGRDYYPGDEQTKTSLLRKLLRVHG